MPMFRGHGDKGEPAKEKQWVRKEEIQERVVYRKSSEENVSRRKEWSAVSNIADRASQMRTEVIT